MAFKKTSEGRVFFQGGNGSSTANESRTPAAKKPAQQARPDVEPGSNYQGPTQLQILALLRSLNDKLKATQVERKEMRAELESYRRSMDALNNKAQRGERAEKIAQETMKEMEETRKLLLDLEGRQSEFEKESKGTAEKIRIGVGSYRDLVKRIEVSEQKNAEIAQKVEEATAQQAKIMRQIEKAIEDRTRFMRKIERIEETVVQTRDALNAKAMVLLTDQNIAGEGAKTIPQEPGIPTAIPDEEIIPESWSGSRALQAAAILLLVVGGILAGWAVSEMQRPAVDSGEFEISDYNAPAASSTPEIPTDAADDIVNKWRVSEDTSAFSGTESAPATPAPATADASDDIGVDLTDQAKLQQMLEENPDAVAAELNKIEPSTAATREPAAAPAATAIEPTPEEAEEMEVASLPAQETATIEQETPTAAPPAAAAPAYKKSSVSTHAITPDNNLPPVVKNIETQAFEGSAEAQHDLAAIYTAGHAGVSQDFKRALFWFEQAANAGVPNAAYNLGVLHHQGLGTKPDIKKAIQWYTKAADLGHPEAQYNLGIAYIEGVGVAYDPFKANAYFEKAAAQGIMEAAYNLGLIYENGLLGKPQPDKALVWYKDAADKGSPEAKAALAQLAKTMNVSTGEINNIVNDVKKSQGETKAPPPSQIKSEAPAPSGVNRELLAQIQEKLMDEGLFPGPADGSNGPLTEDAIRSYQQLNGLEVTGKPSDALLASMLSNEDKKEARYNYNY